MPFMWGAMRLGWSPEREGDPHSPERQGHLGGLPPQLAAWTREPWAKSTRMSQDSTLVPGLPFGLVQLSNLTFQGQDEMSEAGSPGVWSTLLSICAGLQQPHRH